MATPDSRRRNLANRPTLYHIQLVAYSSSRPSRRPRINRLCNQHTSGSDCPNFRNEVRLKDIRLSIICALVLNTVITRGRSTVILQAESNLGGIKCVGITVKHIGMWYRMSDEA